MCKGEDSQNGEKEVYELVMQVRVALCAPEMIGLPTAQWLKRLICWSLVSCEASGGAAGFQLRLHRAKLYAARESGFLLRYRKRRWPPGRPEIPTDPKLLFPRLHNREAQLGTVATSVGLSRQAWRRTVCKECCCCCLISRT